MYVVISDMLVCFLSPAVCPDKEPGLQPWMAGHSEDHRVTIGYGRKVLLTTSATVHSIEILSGGELHIGSRDCPYKGNLTISLFGRLDDSDNDHSYFGKKYIGVGTGGTLEIHGEKKLSWTFLNKTLHPGESNQNNYLFQRGWGSRGIIIHVIDPKSGEVLHNDRFDTYRSKDESRRLAKYVDGVGAGLILALMVNDEGSNNLEDSAKKILFRLGSQHINTLGFRHPWTFIVTKGDPSSVVEGHASYQGPQDDERGSGDWEKVSDLHEAHPDKLCSNPLDIQQQEAPAPPESGSVGVGLSIWSADHQSQPPSLCCWTPWQGPDPGWHHGAAGSLHGDKQLGQAETLDGIAANQTGDVIHKNDKDYGFVCLNKDQTHGLCRNYRVRFLCGKLVRPQASVSIDMLSNSSILELGDEAQGWRSGDRVVVASTDYSMHQAEEFSLMPCSTCTSSQVKVQVECTAAGVCMCGREERLQAKFIHMGEEVDGVDMRAEVGLLTRNILVRGEMEPGCYGNEACNFFDFDTFGGHVKVERGFRAVHISGVELQHMGQQTMGHYPVHFHMNGDVDERGGYDPPTAVTDLSIHHSFSRCVTIHSSNGLLVKDVVGYDTLGHCFFTEDGPEERNTFDHCLGLMVRAGMLLPSDRDSKNVPAHHRRILPRICSQPPARLQSEQGNQPVSMNVPQPLRHPLAWGDPECNDILCAHHLIRWKDRGKENTSDVMKVEANVSNSTSFLLDDCVSVTAPTHAAV
ncbi:hypothetical protein KUCAC02_001748, partial [Chaenocephalus aceratus]